MEENKEEWLNPESPNYYKGYRYVKLGCIEFWYDENDLRRKTIVYYNSGEKYSESYINENGKLHNEEGYAYQEWNENGYIVYQQYRLNGKLLTEQEWKEKTGKIESTQPDYLNPESPNYYKGYRYEKNKYGDEYWYDENNAMRKIIIYWDAMTKYGEGCYNENNKRHSEEGYAYQQWNKNGCIERKEYWLNDERLTEQEWKQKTGK